MAKVIQSKASVKVQTTITLELNEDEARALDAIFGYNVDAFLRVFYERMGKAYVQPHEAGVRSLHKTIRGTLANPLDEVSRLRLRVHQATQPHPATQEEIKP